MPRVNAIVDFYSNPFVFLRKRSPLSTKSFDMWMDYAVQWKWLTFYGKIREMTTTQESRYKIPCHIGISRTLPTLHVYICDLIEDSSVQKNPSNWMMMWFDEPWISRADHQNSFKCTSDAGTQEVTSRWHARDKMTPYRDAPVCKIVPNYSSE